MELPQLLPRGLLARHHSNESCAGMTLFRAVFACALPILLAPTPIAAQQVVHIQVEPSQLHPLPFEAHGRVESDGRGSFIRQWPGTYFELAFRGRSAIFRLGPGDVSLRVRVDGGRAIALVKPQPGLYQIAGVPAAIHRLRIDVVSESQEEPSIFDGFFGPSGDVSQQLPHRARQIEFIGDSYTLGYGNTSTKRECTDQEVWSTTDTSQGIAPRVAGRFHADYQVNAISGRGVVRNYNGFRGAPLPNVYPYVLFDQKRVYSDPNWQPQLILIGLGTNDFSTALTRTEKWKKRAELRRDFENGYVRFVKYLRARNPGAFILLWIADTGNAETTSEVANVADYLRRSGEERLGFVAIRGLALSGCNYHPSVGDDEVIAETLGHFIDEQPRVWLSR